MSQVISQEITAADIEEEVHDNLRRCGSVMHLVWTENMEGEKIMVVMCPPELSCVADEQFERVVSAVSRFLDPYIEEALTRIENEQQS